MATELNELTGYVDGDEYPLGEEFLIRSPVTLNYRLEEDANVEKAEGNDDTQDDDIDDNNADAAMVAIYITNNDEEDNIEFYDDKTSDDSVSNTSFHVNYIHYC